MFFRSVEKQSKAMERSSFTVTCSLLSQYLKENRSFGDHLGIQKLQCSLDMEKSSFQPPTTMNLFPGSDISAGSEPEPAEESELCATVPEVLNAVFKTSESAVQREGEINSQLTILYDGKVMVFDNFPARKARELMVMASKGNTFASNTEISSIMAAPSDRMMPIARRASLHRFLQKRKDRIKSNAPYLVNGFIEVMKSTRELEKNHGWLELGHISDLN